MQTQNINIDEGPQWLDRDQHFGSLYTRSWAIGFISLLAAVGFGLLQNDHFKHFFYSYLTAYLFFLSIALGGLAFVLVQHVTKAAWSVGVRRIAEWLASTLPFFALLALPIAYAALSGTDRLYPWAAPAWQAIDHGFKGHWLTPTFFVARLVIYFIIWCTIASYYSGLSQRQDVTGDIQLTLRMEWWAPISLILLMLSLTFFIWDVSMSLDPSWYSTIFGIYYLAGCLLGAFSTIIIIASMLQHRGMLLKSVTREHYHDLGKFLFGFTFFWGYIAFSQYMLQWYGNIPDETIWYLHHGASTQSPNGWSYLLIVLLFGHFLIPFPGLLSRHVKRNAEALPFWAWWVLAFCFVDQFWLVMPNLNNDGINFNQIDLTVILGLGGLAVGNLLRVASYGAIRPQQDPRLSESLALQNL